MNSHKINSVNVTVAKDSYPQKQIITEARQSKKKFNITDDWYKAIIQTTPDGFFLSDLEGNIVDVNSAYCNMVGYSRNELLSMSVSDLDIEFIGAPKKLKRRILKHKDKGSADFFAKHKCKDGKVIDVAVSLQYLDIKQGLFFCFHRDVTELREAHESLRKSKEFTEGIITSVKDGISVLDNHGVHLEINPSFCQMTGFIREELIGVGPPHPYWPEEEYENIQAAFQKTLKGEFSDFELIFKNKNGERFPVIVSPSCVKDDQGNIVNYFATIKDITERKKIEEELQNTNEYFTNLTKSMGDVVFSLKIPERIIEWVSDSIRLIGYQPKECIGKTTEFLYQNKGDFIEFGGKINDAIISGRKMFHAEQLLKRENGEVFPVEINCAFSKTTGDITHITSIVRDITERKKSEKQLEEYRKHLKQLVEERTIQLSLANKQLERMLQKQQDLVKQRADYTRALVHELKTPLTAVISSSEVLIKQLKDKLELRLAKNIYKGANNLDKRIDELLDLARCEVGALKITHRLFNPLKLICEVADHMTPEATKEGQSVILDVPNKMPNVWADRERIRQVLLNLISNGLKFNSDKGRLIIRGRVEDQNIICEIQDEGRGITDKEQERLFEPYYRIESDREHFSGLGLGLALSKKILKLHNGNIWVKSEKGKGSTFTFSLPFTTEAK